MSRSSAGLDSVESFSTSPTLALQRTIMAMAMNMKTSCFMATTKQMENGKENDSRL
jgi:hypothetical protein